MLTRREAALSFGALWTVLAIPGGAAAQAALTWTPKALTPAQARTLDAVAEAIMPTTGTPGARAAGVPQFIDRAVSGWCEPAEAARIRGGLDRIDADARAAHGAGFAGLTGAQQAALLARYDEEAAAAKPGQPHPFATVRDWVTTGYFTSEAGATQALRYDPVPGDYKGCIPLKDVGRAWATS